MNPGFSGFETKSYPQLDDEPELVTWLLDTRTLWPGDNIWTAKGAAYAMGLISLEEQNAIASKMFIADARMSLGSALLKRLFISKALGISWTEVRLARKGNEKHGKPCAVDNYGRPISGIDFNVSHQNGLVSLIGWDGCDDVMVGTDIVCVNERETARQTIDEEGFDGWVDIYDAVFSLEERWSMKYDVDAVTLLDGTRLSAHEIGRNDRCIQPNQELTCTKKTGEEITFSSELLIDAKLRRFYTYFTLKEAYIKLAGEGLLAPWLKQLEFFNVRSPRPGTVARCSTHGTWGEEVDDAEVKLHGRHVNDVKMKVQAFEEDFMISCAIQGNIQGLKIPAFQKLHLDKDVLNIARDTLERKDSFMSPAEAIEQDLNKGNDKSPNKDTSDIDYFRSVADVESLLSPWESRYW
ncbi:hypothetical protein BAUCODRAFT_74871 [Baudoinia panamericana UAMH 10762]|uniref:holo-[acyl-carrier-protein] synthase n=1 Tax=Baudoinia panamericana (strain UAMH 10762) TaxID=717646 RepID=M2N586_BAUPA|nr:uncharacterized protein BAUCODRAFT_74871 [Baudoinia panamericana UAMH 10762]EMC94199.1 hypothetical protein BAUCODRAFT_74871 [Baudoinia panamericana UAMH 10762]